MPKDFLNSANNFISFFIEEVELSLLLQNQFISSFINNGKVYILSQQSFIDTENCICITPAGLLILVVSKDIYEELGLQGKPVDKKSQRTNDKKYLRYLVEIDLTNILSNEKLHHKVLDSLHRLKSDLTFNLCISWQPNDKEICATSILSYFEYFNKNTSDLKSNVVSRILKDAKIPILQFDDTDNFQEIFEWLGAISCGCEFGAVDNFENTMVVPKPVQIYHKSINFKIAGFYTPYFVDSILKKIKQVLENDCSIPFAIVTVYGFSDSPVTLKDPNSNSSSQTLFVFNSNHSDQINLNYWLVKAFDHRYLF